MSPIDDPRAPTEAPPRAAPATDAATLDTWFEALAADTVDRPPSWRDRLRERPTPQRVALAAGAALVASALYAVIAGLRSDLAGEAMLRFAVIAVGFTALGVGAASLTLRSLAARPLQAALGIPLALLAVPFVVSVLPGLLPGPTGPVPTTAHLGCAVGSLIAATLSALAVLVFDRDDRPPSWRLLSGGAAGGLFAYVAQLSHCPSANAVHLAVTHASAGVLVGAGLALLVALRR